MGGASLIETLHQADMDATLWLNSLSTPFTEQMWQLFSNKGFWIPMYAILLYLLFDRLGWKRALVVLASVALAFGLCDQCSNLVKYSVARLRPSYNSDMLQAGLNVLEGRGGFYGFFSAHAANAFAVATCLNIGFRADKTHTYNALYKVTILWATLVSVSRIFVGKHFLGDVLAGILIGSVIGYFVAMLARHIIRKHIEKVKPEGLTFHFDLKPSGENPTVSE